MNADRRRSTWLIVAMAVGALVLGIATTMVLAGTGAFRHAAPLAWRAQGARCSAPALPGKVVDVAVSDMGPGLMGGPGHGMRMMRLVARPATATAGVVSLRVLNTGAMAHEVVVLPLSSGQGIGERPTGPAGKVSEEGSLGEASRSCAAGEGHGIAPGAMAWTTLTMRPGRYELVCNLPGHYLAGMYAELDVTSR
ncbi:hypothetical protein ABT213_23295 [Streptomyces sp. NPDC001674]|uniref:hypothetical protein n=1 Tax=Streptomyces sp. NPDC001674 TaxID=3154394 RepID=UPI00331AE27A